MTADLRMVNQLGGYGVAAVTALTVQDHLHFDCFEPVAAELIRRQISWLLDRYPVRAVKLGMLARGETVLAVADSLMAWPGLALVIDPILCSTSGSVLLDESGFDLICDRLLPRATLITPNLAEARLLDKEEMAYSAPETLAQALQRRFGVAVLLKGGHAEGDLARDLLVDEKGHISGHDGPRVFGVNGHGTGCRLASAIATGLALGFDLLTAVTRAKEAQNRLFQNPVVLDGFGSVLG